MEDQEIKNKIGYLRWFISIFFVIYLFVDLIISRNNLTYFHYLVVVFLFILGIADRFKFIKIPGFVELKDKTEIIDKKIDRVVEKIQQIQTVSINLNPTQTPQTFTSPPTNPPAVIPMPNQKEPPKLKE